MRRVLLAAIGAGALIFAACGSSIDQALEIRLPDNWTVLQEPIDAPSQAPIAAEDLEPSWPEGCDVSYIDLLVNPTNGSRQQLAVARRDGDVLVNVLLWGFESEADAAVFVGTYRNAPDACWTWSLSDGPVLVEGSDVDLVFSSGEDLDYHAEVITDLEDQPKIGVEAQLLIAQGSSVVLFFTQPDQFGGTNQSYVDATLEAFSELAAEY